MFPWNAKPRPATSRRSSLPHRSLITRYSIAIGTLVIFGELVLGGWQVQQRYKYQLQTLEAHIARQGEFLSTVTPTAVSQLDFRTLDTLMQQTSLNRDVAYSIAVDARGRALTRDIDRQHPVIRRTLNHHPALTTSLDIIQVVRQQPWVREVRVPILRDGQTLGEIWLGYSIENVERERWRGLLSTVAIAGSIVLLLGSCTAILLVREVKRPLQELVELSQALGREGLDNTSPISLHRPQRTLRQDEIGQLQQAFENMACQLSERSHQRQQAETALKQSETAIRTLYQVASSPQLDFNGRLQGLLAMGRQHFQMEVGILGQVQGIVLELVAVQDPQQHLSCSVDTQFPSSHPICARILRQGQVVAETDLEAANPEVPQNPLPWGLKAYFGVPVRVGERIDGMLAFVSRQPRQTPFVDRDRQLLQLMAQWLGREIERHRARTVLEQQFQRTLILERITRNVRQSLDSQAIFQTAIEEISAALAVDRGLIHSYHPGQPPQIPIVAEFLREGYSSARDLAIPVCYNPHMQELLNGDRAIASDDVDADPLLLGANNLCCQLELKSMLAVRTSYKGQPNGIIGLHQCDRYRHWTQADIELLEAVANQVGIALGHAQLLERETQQRQQLSQQNQALETARQAAVAANRAKSEFLATMSHELRTPLNAALLATNLLTETPLSPRQQQLVQTAQHSDRDLLEIVNNILDFANLEFDDLQLDPQPFCLLTALDELLNHFLPKARDRGLDLRSHLDRHTPTYIVADPQRWRNILHHLIDNAIKFTETGSISVSVQCLETAAIAAADAAEVRLWVAVCDTGIGISQLTRSRLFQFFTQGDTSITRKYGGMGLGLAIASRLVHLMGGYIWADSGGDLVGYPPPDFAAQSSPDRPGTIFSFCLNVGVAPDPAIGDVLRLPQPRQHTYRCDRSPPSPSPVPTPTAANFGALRILLAEDNHVNQDITLLLLETLGLQADVVDNGLAVLQRLQSQAYDAILMDLEMPYLDGISTTREIHRRYQPESRPYIIAITAYATTTDRENSRQAGIDEYLTKPLQPEDLKQALTRVIPRGRDPVLDRRVLDDIRQMAGDRAPAFLKKLVQTYCDEMPARLQRLHTAVETGNAEDLRCSAHALRSSSVNLGAIALAQVCRTLERLGRNGSVAEAAEYLTCLENEYAKLQTALQAECQP